MPGPVSRRILAADNAVAAAAATDEPAQDTAPRGPSDWRTAGPSAVSGRGGPAGRRAQALVGGEAGDGGAVEALLCAGRQGTKHGDNTVALF
jgi:hypothetical protein